MNIIDYYSDENVLNQILSSVNDSGHRVWKVQDSTGAFRQNGKKINSIRKLKDFLLNIKYTENNEPVITAEPVKVFVSVARFMNPERVYGKVPKSTHWLVDDSLFLSSELLFDLDSEEDISVAHQDGKVILNFMSAEKDYKLKNIRYSGTKGFHLLYEDISIQHNNIEQTYNKRLELVNRLPTLNTIDDLHKGIICDQFRVHAALGTVKGKTGHKVVEIKLEDFISLSTKELMHKYVESVVRPVHINGPMITDGQGASIHRTSIMGKERPTLSSSRQEEKSKPTLPAFPLYYNFVNNMVKGTPGYITVLQYQNTKNVTSIINSIQKQFNLPEFYIFQYKDIKMYICLKLIDMPRLLKIMRKAKPMNLNSFMFYGYSWIPISNTKNSTGIEIYNKPIYVGKIESKYCKSYTASRPHANLLGLKFNKMAGSNMNKILNARIKEK